MCTVQICRQRYSMDTVRNKLHSKYKSLKVRLGIRVLVVIPSIPTSVMCLVTPCKPMKLPYNDNNVTDSYGCQIS